MPTIEMKEPKEKSTKSSKTVDLEQKNKFTLIYSALDEETEQQITELLQTFQPDFPVHISSQEATVTFKTKYDDNQGEMMLTVTYEYKKIRVIETKQLKIQFNKQEQSEEG